MHACPNRTGRGWTTIYEQIQTRMKNLQKTEQVLGIDFNRPLVGFDHLDKLNDLARKKRKHSDDIQLYMTTSGLLKVCKKKIVRSLTTDFNLGYLYIQIDEDYWSVLEPFSLSVDLNIKSPKCKLAEEKFSRFSLVGNSKLNDVDLLLEAETKCFSSKRFTRREKDCFISKGIKQISLGKYTSKVGIKVQLLSLKDCTFVSQGMRVLNGISTIHLMLEMCP
ncbi:hypothetical protein Tco_1141216, partial [Tanacetum coccineum]